MVKVFFPLLALVILNACDGGSAGPAAPRLTEEERLAMAPSPANGRALFSECALCHEAAADGKHGIGPNLWGVYGQPAARLGDFSYSRAMRNAGLSWDGTTLSTYLENPQRTVPGNRMAYAGMPSEANRRDVIAYLETLTGE